MPEIRVENLRALHREIRIAAGPGAAKALRRAGALAVQPIVVEAKIEVVKRSGRLAGSIAGGATARGAFVKAGTAKRVPYAGVNNYGWPAASMQKALQKSRSRLWRNVGKTTRGVKGAHWLDNAAKHETPAVAGIYERTVREALEGIDTV